MTAPSGRAPQIDFRRLADALLPKARDLLASWLPGGRVEGGEYLGPSRKDGGHGDSLRVNLRSGVWALFSGGDADKGGDLTSLYAWLHGLTQAEAARELMPLVGMAVADGAVQAPVPAPAPRPLPAPAEAAPEGWQTVRPVPGLAPPVNFRHHHRQAEDIEHVAEYRTGDDLHGYVVRFRTSDGGKDPIPRTWCVSTRDGAACWKWRQWDEPRPLYLPGHALPAGRTVLLVEGEKKADALQAVLEQAAPGVYAVASWPGGSKAWHKADWRWLAGLHVVAWPDCDAKHEALTAAERKATPDKLAQRVLQQGKPLLPAARQPGMAAMLGIGAHLRDVQGCTVQLLPIPEPGAVADGWDCGDAIHTDGWGPERVLQFLGAAYALPEWAGTDKPAHAAGGGTADASPPTSTRGLADAGEEDDAFAAHLDRVCELLKCERGQLGVTRKLVIAALKKAPALEGCLGFNELTGAPCTVRPWPWREERGPLAESDDLRLGDWLSRKYSLKSASRAALSEAMDTVADGCRFHPIRDWLRGLQHDGKPRLDRWLMHVLRIDGAALPPRRQKYLALMGRYMLMGLVARVMTPGCKFDYSPVLEGRTGVGKSTLVEVLVGKEQFSDTHFDIGSGKDGMEQLEGLWAYELSELTAFKRADSEQIKQFFTSTVDRFRGAYGKFVQPHPRQCVIFCTTNKRQYLYDLSSQRRFWPVWVEERIRLEWLRTWRAQLFAEAYAQWADGQRYTPTPEEEAQFFLPEQRLRVVETTVHARLYELLAREGGDLKEPTVSRDMCMFTTFVTLPQLCLALGADPAKSTSILEGQIRAWLDAHGWMAGRETTGARRRGFRRPDVWPPQDDDDDGVPPVRASSADEGNADGPARAGAAEDSDDEPF